MSDDSGRTPEEPVVPDEAAVADDAVVPEAPEIPPADVVIPPPPPEIPIPDGLLSEPPTEASTDDALIPPPPAERRRRSAHRSRQTPEMLDGEPPAAAADDWSQPSVAPEVPTSGGYRGLTVAIFAFLFLLAVAAIGVIVFLLNTSGLPFLSSADSAEQFRLFLNPTL